MMIKPVGVGALALCAATIVGAPLAAKSTREARVLAPFEQCGQIISNAERLACFDVALSELDELREVEDRRDAQVTAETFGLSRDVARKMDSSLEAPSGSQNAVTQDEDGKFTVTMVVADVLQDGARQTVILFENGQLWREASNGSLRGLRAGWQATISESRFGGFRLRVPQRSGFMSVQRIR